MKCEICGKDILRDSQCINYKYYHNDCIENLQQENKQLKENYERIYNENCKLREEHNITDISLLDEKQELKSQLEDTNEELELVRCDLHNRTFERDGYEKELNKCLSKQKEFIEWLENEINKLKEQIKNYDIWHEVGTDINFLILKKQFYLEILQKYKSIIGGINDKK